MDTRRRTRITIETERLLVVSRRDGAAQRCPACDSEVSLVTPEDANAYLQVSLSSIFRLIELGQVHFAELRNGALRVCLACVRNGSTAAPSGPK